MAPNARADADAATARRLDLWNRTWRRLLAPLPDEARRAAPAPPTAPDDDAATPVATPGGHPAATATP